MSGYFKGKKITRCSKCGDYTLRNIPEDHDVPQELKDAARLTDYWKKLLEDTEKLCDDLGVRVIEDTESLVSHETIEFMDGSLKTSETSMYIVEEFTPYGKRWADKKGKQVFIKITVNSNFSYSFWWLKTFVTFWLIVTRICNLVFLFKICYYSKFVNIRSRSKYIEWKLLINLNFTIAPSISTVVHRVGLMRSRKWGWI